MRHILCFGWQDKTQLTMLVTWVVELFLSQLGQLKEQGEEGSEKYEVLQESFRKFLEDPRVKVGHDDVTSCVVHVHSYHVFNSVYMYFQKCTNENRMIIYDLIASHGDVEDHIFFAMIMRGQLSFIDCRPIVIGQYVFLISLTDFERVITHYIQHENYKEALNVLVSKQVI